MRLLKHLIAGLIVVAAQMPAFADGLIYSLPKDGTKVVFDFKGNKSDANDSRDFTGTFSIASVGQETVNGEKCRWIELGMEMNADGRMRTVTTKMLITETDIGKGKIPLGNVKRAWIKNDKREAEKIDDVYGRKGGPIPAFFPAPLSETKQQAAEEVETGAGKYQCRGLTGRTEYDQGNEQRKDQFKVEYELRLSDKIPFGVAKAKITMKEYVRKMRLDDTITLELTLKSISRNAKSAIADKN